MNKKPDISIVMGYFRRANLLENTLKTISQQTSIANIEVVIVNDDVVQQDIIDLCNNHQNQGPFGDIKLFHTNRDYYFRNPNYAYNVAIKRATADHIIIQNPECAWVGDVASGLLNLMSNKTKPYYCCRCLSLSAADNKIFDEKINRYELSFGLFNDRPEYVGRTNPRPFHFCLGMNRHDMIAMGGFDERIKDIAHDDDLLAFTVARNNFDIRILSDEPFYVLHQNHDRSNQQHQGTAQAANRSYMTYQTIVKNIISGAEPPVANFNNPNWGVLDVQ